MESEAWRRFRDSYGTPDGFLRDSYLNASAPVPTGIAPLDAMLCGGMRPGLHVLGGEPGAGKSAFGLFVALMSASSGANVMFASLEMSAAQCWSRCLSCASTASPSPFRWGDVWRMGRDARARLDEALRRGESEAATRDFEESDPVAEACRAVSARCPGLLIAGPDGLGEVGGLEGAARRGSDAGLSLLVVDYLQYVGVAGVTDEYTRVSEASRRLNALGVSLGIPVLALASNNRAAKAGQPGMHSFKGSGDIEYHALSACVLEADPEDAGRRLLHVVKNRFGWTTGESPIPLEFDGSHNAYKVTESR